MGTTSNWNIQWPNCNSQRRYPLADFATATDATGAFTLPDDFLLELYLPVHVGGGFDPTMFYLRSVTASAAGYVLVIGYDHETLGTIAVARATVPKAMHEENDSYLLVGLSTDPEVGGFEDSIGRIAVGRLDSIDLQPAGMWTFDYAGGALTPDCIRPIVRGVMSVRLVSGEDVSAAIYDHIELVEGDNVRLTYTETSVDGEVHAQIRIDADASAGAASECSCAGSGTTGSPIYTINGVGPDDSGNFAIEAGDCIDVTSVTNGVSLSNSCATPCCGCTELSALYQEQQHTNDQAAILRGFVDKLRAQYDNFSTVVLASRLADASCITC